MKNFKSCPLGGGEGALRPKSSSDRPLRDHECLDEFYHEYIKKTWRRRENLRKSALLEGGRGLCPEFSLTE